MSRPSVERLVPISCADARTIGIYHEAETALDVLAVIVVGGPQYRVGSHRMFVTLSRVLAGAGINAFRFDCRGMGDAEGEFQSFDALDDDIRCAIDAAIGASAGVALVGLCDGATAAALYGFRDPRVSTMVLINPWVHTEVSEAKAKLSNYYQRRFFQRRFWADLMVGRIDLVKSMRSFVVDVLKSSQRAEPVGFVDRMLDALRSFDRPVAFLLSANDVVAQELEILTKNSVEWDQVIRRANVSVYRCPEADHTFSEPDHAAWLSRQTAEFIRAAHAPLASSS